MERGFRLGSILGFEIRIDHSWFVIFFLILWSLSVGVFPNDVPGRARWVYLAMGTVGTLLFFASLLAHEISHSVVARAKGVEVEGITLFIFGGMARTRKEAETPGDEFLIAGVGPLMSFFLAAVFLGAGWLAGQIPGVPEVRVVATYLGWVNLLLAVFNLLPGFPLDGGRIFRALVWKKTGSRTRATRWATGGGKILGYALMLLGFLQIFAGAMLGGLWLVFIGWFLRSAAETSLQQDLLVDALRGVKVRDLMSPDPQVVPPDLPVQDLVDHHLLRRRFQAFPVVHGERLVGLVTLDEVKALPREAWGTRRVFQIMRPADDLVVDPELALTAVLERMRDHGAKRLLVVSGGRLEGIVSSSDIARWFQRNQDLEGQL